MRASRHGLIWLLIITVAGLATATPVEAWYGHRNYRSYRSGRMAGVQRASSALGTAQARLSAAQMNAARQIRQAKQAALNSPELTSAKSAETQATRDYQSAKEAVVNQLKTTNPEFSDLLAESNAKRDRIAALAKSGDTSGQIQTLEGQLKTLVRKVVSIQDRAINADPTLKEIASRTAGVHASAQSAEKDAKNAVYQDPGVLAAQKQLTQAQIAAQQAAARYNNALGSANSGMYGGNRYHRRYGYGGYGGITYSPRYYTSYHNVHYAHARPVHIHHAVRHRR